VGGNDCQTAGIDEFLGCAGSEVVFGRHFDPFDTNIRVHRSRPSAKAGKFITVTSQITNQYDNNITYEEPVTWTVVGGVFSDGTTQQTVEGGNTGRSQVAVTKLKKGKAKVTATIGGATNFDSFCGQHAGEAAGNFWDPTARAGNCKAHTTLHFHGKAKPQVERPHLSAGNVHHHHVKLKAKTHPSLTNVKVKFFKKTGSGLKKLVGADRTNSNGVAKSKVHVHGHHKYVSKVVGLGSLFKSKFSNKVLV
jgi:hypothetical protein